MPGTPERIHQSPQSPPNDFDPVTVFRCKVSFIRHYKRALHHKYEARRCLATQDLWIVAAGGCLSDRHGGGVDAALLEYILSVSKSSTAVIIKSSYYNEPPD